MAINSAPSVVRALRNEKADGTEATEGMVPTVQSDGEVDFETPAGGDPKWVFLGRDTENNTSGNVQLTLKMSDTYRHYKLVVEYLKSNFTHNFMFNWTNSGVQLFGANHNWTRSVRNGVTETYTQATGQTKTKFIDANFADGVARGVINIYRPLDAETYKPAMHGEFIFSKGSTIEKIDIASHYNVAGQNVGGVRLETSDSSVWEAAMSLYGLKNS